MALLIVVCNEVARCSAYGSAYVAAKSKAPALQIHTNRLNFIPEIQPIFSISTNTFAVICWFSISFIRNKTVFSAFRRKPTGKQPIPIGKGRKPTGIRPKPIGIGAKQAGIGRIPLCLGLKPIGIRAIPTGIGRIPIGIGRKLTGIGAKPTGISRIPIEIRQKAVEILF